MSHLFLHTSNPYRDLCALEMQTQARCAHNTVDLAAAAPAATLALTQSGRDQTARLLHLEMHLR